MLRLFFRGKIRIAILWLRFLVAYYKVLMKAYQLRDHSLGENLQREYADQN